MTRIVHTEKVKSAQVCHVVELLNHLENLAPRSAIVHVRNADSGNVESATLIERDLTDGSTVYDIVVNFYHP